jgi:hypothetical protein
VLQDNKERKIEKSLDACQPSFNQNLRAPPPPPSRFAFGSFAFSGEVEKEKYVHDE